RLEWRASSLEFPPFGPLAVLEVADDARTAVFTGPNLAVGLPHALRHDVVIADDQVRALRAEILVHDRAFRAMCWCLVVVTEYFASGMCVFPSEVPQSMGVW